MSTKLDLKSLPQQFKQRLRVVGRYRLVAFICFVALVYGFVLLRINTLSNIQPSADAVTVQHNPIKTARIDPTVVKQLQSAQLALVNIEDVTAEQNGILAHMFNYGVLKAETAGHRSKFVFPYCPNPNFYAQQILTAREALGSAGHHSQPAPQPQQPPASPPTYS